MMHNYRESARVSVLLLEERRVSDLLLSSLAEITHGDAQGFSVGSFVRVVKMSANARGTGRMLLRSGPGGTGRGVELSLNGVGRDAERKVSGPANCRPGQAGY